MRRKSSRQRQQTDGGSENDDGGGDDDDSDVQMAKQLEAMKYNMLKEHLEDFLEEHRGGGPKNATYEEWIEDLHPEFAAAGIGTAGGEAHNAAPEDTGAEESSARSIIQDDIYERLSDHRKLWSEKEMERLNEENAKVRAESEEAVKAAMRRMEFMNEENDEYWREMDPLYKVRAESKAAMMKAVGGHLDRFLREWPGARYEEWIEDLHPDNVKGVDGHGLPVIDDRFYAEESDHRKLWNENLLTAGGSGRRTFVPSRDKSGGGGEGEGGGEGDTPVKGPDIASTDDARGDTPVKGPRIASTDDARGDTPVKGPDIVSTDDAIAEKQKEEKERAHRSSVWLVLITRTSVLAVLLIAVVSKVGLPPRDAFCAPCMPGTDLSNSETASAFDAPWWAPRPLKEQMFGVLCSGRPRTRLEWSRSDGRGDGGNGKLTIRNIDGGKILMQEKGVQLVEIKSDGGILLTNKKGGKVAQRKEPPWAAAP